MSQKNKNFIIIGISFSVLILIVFFITFFSKKSFIVKNKTQQINQIKVVASFYPLYFLAQEIGGQWATVVNITPAGAEPHDYELTPADMIKIENSQLLILNGGHLEAWGPHIKQLINPHQTVLIIAAAGLTNRQINRDGRSIVDPHVWLSPILAQRMVDKISAGFIKVDPQHRDYYQHRAQELKIKLQVLDQEYLQTLKDCQQKDIVTAHAAFGYLASQYQLQQVPIAGLSPNSEPSPKQLISLVKLVRKQKIKYIFFESLVSPKLADTIAQEVGAQTLELNPIEGLTPQEVQEGKNYFTEMRSNLKNLKIALECH